MKKQVINEREINQRMIKYLREDESDTPNNTDGTTVNPSQSDISKDQEEFRQNVASDAKFIEFSILPDANNVVFKGSIPGVCEWKFELVNRNGVEIVIPEPITMTSEILEIFNDMNGVFLNWKEEWGPKLTEYQQNGNA